MKLAETSRLKIEEFFREHLGDDQFRLPEIYFYGGRLTRALTGYLKIEGLTVGRRVFILPRNFWFCENRKRRLDEELVVHEIAHVLQYRREGFWPFLWKYLQSYRRNLKNKPNRDAHSKAQAYLEIPYEIEARKTAAKFVVWSRKRKEKSV
jgi:hypothetical protein